MMTANASMATLRLLNWAKRDCDGVLIEALGLARPEYINLVVEDLLRSSRLFLLLESQFQIKALSRNILLALGRSADKREYYNVAKDVIATAGLADRDLKLRVLNVPALRDKPRAGRPLPDQGVPRQPSWLHDTPVGTDMRSPSHRN